MSSPLRLRDRVGLNVPPLLLRLMLGIIFLWAGLGKISEYYDVSGESAAMLANMGVIVPPAPSPKLEIPRPTETKPPETKPAEPKPPEPAPGKASGAAGAATIVPVAQPKSGAATRQFTATDFPSPVRVRRLFGLALLLHGAANPEAGKTPLWPAGLATGSMPVYLAWSVAVTELAAGVFVLVGLLTRLSALGIAGVMLGAMWLTEIGPAIQTGKAVLGFLPDYPPFDPQWQSLLFQVSLCMAALALAFCGPGRLSLDTALLWGRDEDDDED